MRIAHPNGVQGRRPINSKKREKKKKEVATLQKIFETKIKKALKKLGLFKPSFFNAFLNFVFQLF